ncbi:MAG: hypothetical protein HY456_02330 [Parcubacteria group bacterium]|nr:hypothetical protein [Parcubacteria group bacterium]
MERDFLKDYYLIVPFAASVFLWMISAALVFNVFKGWDAQVILHWDFYRGIDVRGDAAGVRSLVYVAAAALAIDGALAVYLFHREKFLAYFISFSALVFSVFVLMAVGAVAYFN